MLHTTAVRLHAYVHKYVKYEKDQARSTINRSTVSRKCCAYKIDRTCSTYRIILHKSSVKGIFQRYLSMYLVDISYSLSDTMDIILMRNLCNADFLFGRLFIIIICPAWGNTIKCDFMPSQTGDSVTEWFRTQQMNLWILRWTSRHGCGCGSQFGGAASMIRIFCGVAAPTTNRCDV